MAEYMKEFHSNSGIFVKGYLKVKLPFGKQIATNQIPPGINFFSTIINNITMGN